MYIQLDSMHLDNSSHQHQARELNGSCCWWWWCHFNLCIFFFSCSHSHTTAKKHCFIFTWLHTTTLPTTFYDVNSQRKKEKRDKENKKQFFSAAFFLFIFFSRWWRARRPTTKTVEVLGRWVGVVVMTLTSFHFLCSKIHEINCELIFGTRDKRGGEKWDGWESETKKWKQKRQFKTKALYFSVLQQ